MTEREFLEKVLKNAPAADYCLALFRVSQIWDDLIDGDKEPSKDEINRAFYEALVAIPANPFFQAHANVLLPGMQMVIFDWFDANTLEQGDAHDKSIAFVLRDNLISIVVQCAYLCGGYEHAKTVGPEIRRYFFDERLGDYMQ